MAVTNYHTANGRVISQNSTKDGYQYLLQDPLGNVIATVDDKGTKSNDTTYWPFGEVRTGGVSSVTNLGFCGGWGYYTDSSSKLYVRARYYRPVLGRWQTVDPLWPSESAYEYCKGNSIGLVDWMGTDVEHDSHGSGEEHLWVDLVFKKLQRRMRDPRTTWESCIQNCNAPDRAAHGLVKIDLTDKLDDLIDRVSQSKWVTVQLDYKCRPGLCGYTENFLGHWFVHICVKYHNPLRVPEGCGPASCILLHELVHALGLKHDYEYDDKVFSCISKVYGCESYTAKTVGD